jgi:hypothetical protein
VGFSGELETLLTTACFRDHSNLRIGFALNEGIGDILLSFRPHGAQLGP